MDFMTAPVLFEIEVIPPNHWFFLVYLREGNEPGETTQITYRQLLVQVCQFSNVLRKQGECGNVGKGLEGLALGYLKICGKKIKDERQSGNRGIEKISRSRGSWMGGSK
jgi:hypothetical protein